MSPEQVRGSAHLDGRSDQFSFGLVLYEIAAGKRPFEDESGVETLMAVLRDDPEPLPAKLPEPPRCIIERCEQRDRSNATNRAAICSSSCDSRAITWPMPPKRTRRSPRAPHHGKDVGAARDVCSRLAADGRGDSARWIT